MSSSRPVRKQLLAIAAVVALFAAAYGLVRAEDAPAPANPPADPGAGVIDPNSLAGKESTEGVYVRDSAIALEKFALAQKMERLKEWNKSADLYQEVIDKYPDRVVPSRTNVDDKIVQYSSVTRGVTERLSHWPKEAREVYLARYEATAASLLQGAGGLTTGADESKLHEILVRYFPTETGKAIGLHLIDLTLERGEFLSATRLAEDLLTLHPGLTPEQRPALLYKVAVAYQLAGEAAKAKERLAQLRKASPDAKGQVRGKEVKLAESLETELNAIAAAAGPETPGPAGNAAALAADTWTTLGGDATRGRVTAAAGRPGARLFAVAYSKPQWRGLAPNTRAQVEENIAGRATAGLLNGVFPVVDRGDLYFQDGTRVFARSLESGDALPGWLQTYPGPEERAGQYVLPDASGAPRTHQLTLTLTDRSVLGVMGQPDRNYYAIGQAPGGEPRLVCLDRRSGKENWLVALSTIELPRELPDDQQKALRALQMNGSPLVVGDSVMVLARGVKQAQFEDCWVLCFQLGTGKFRWSCYVASASNVGGAPWGGQPPSMETTSHLAYANGRVYALSNLGALAAIDAYSGTIAWLSIYERGISQFDGFANQNPGGPNGPGQQAPKPWLYNPVIVKDGRVFVLPTEGRFLYVYDANTGVELKRINRGSWGKVGSVEMLLAVTGDRMVVASDHVVCFFDWPKYDAESPDACLTGVSSEFEGGLRGRPFVTSDSIFVTDARKLHRLTFAQGARVAEDYPSGLDKPWDEREEGPGNVLVTSDHVVIAGATHVYGFTDLGVARARLDREVAAAPQETAPRLRYARVLFTAGDAAGTVAKLDEAIALLGGRSAMRVGADRDWIFNDALAFAQKLMGGSAMAGGSDGDAPPEGEAPKKPAAASLKLADALYDRAASAASSPQQQVHYRLSRARFATQSKEDLGGAAGLYQQILGSPELRPIALVDERTGGPTQAASVAETALRALVARGGAKVYEPFEQAAAKLLADAQAAKPPKAEQLFEVAQAYPNSAAAPRALLAAAEAYESIGQAQSAVQVLRQAYFKYPDAVDRPHVIEAMARGYLALPNRVDVAAARLAQGVALPGEHKLSKPLRLPDGTEIAKDTSFPQALDALRKFSSRIASKDLPDFRLPVPARYPPEAERGRNARWPFPAAGAEPVIAGVDALAVPLRDFGRADRVVAWSADGTKLSVYKPGDLKPLGTSAAALSDAPKGSAWISGAEQVLVWSNSAIALVPERGGDPIWRVEPKALPAIDVVKPRANGAANGDENPRNVARQLQMQLQAQRQLRAAAAFGGANADFIMQNGQPRRIQQPPAARGDAGAAEAIADVLPVGDRVLVTTTTGRVLCVELAGANAGPGVAAAAANHIAWQTRLSDRPADRLVANDDFTVVKVSDETSVRLVCLDTTSGQIRGTKSFPLQNGEFPVNIALSADGTLVYTLPSKLVLKDLFKPWETPDREAPAGGPVLGDAGIANPMPFRNASGPDQLVISEGRILALADMGGGQAGGADSNKYVRVHSLETGQPITLRVPREDGGGQVDLMLLAENKPTRSWDIRLRCVGSRLYIQNSLGLLCYDLDRPEEFWQAVVDDDRGNEVPSVIDLFLGKNHAMVVTQLGAPPLPGAAPAAGQANLHYQLNAYARYPGRAGSTAESGKTDYIPFVSETAPVTNWQGVEGGFYYLTQSNRTLHFLAAVK